MSLCAYPDVAGTTNVSMSVEKDTYIISATGNVTYTLPLITANGITFLISRIDATGNTVTLAAQGGDLISETFGVTSSTKTIGTYRSFQIVSLDNVWYVLYRSNTSLASESYFSTGATSNNGSDFITSNSPISFYIPYVGSNIRVINYIVACVTLELTSPTITLAVNGGGTIKSSIITLTAPFTPRTATVILSDAEKALLPTGTSVLVLTFTNIRVYTFYMA